MSLPTPHVPDPMYIKSMFRFKKPTTFFLTHMRVHAYHYSHVRDVFDRRYVLVVEYHEWRRRRLLKIRLRRLRLLRQMYSTREIERERLFVALDSERNKINIGPRRKSTRYAFAAADSGEFSVTGKFTLQQLSYSAELEVRHDSMWTRNITRTSPNTRSQ